MINNNKSLTKAVNSIHRVGSVVLLKNVDSKNILNSDLF